MTSALEPKSWEGKENWSANLAVALVISLPLESSKTTGPLALFFDFFLGFFLE